MSLGFITGVVVGAVLIILGGLVLLFAVSRPARGRYRVDYHRFDPDGQRVEGTDHVDAMNETHARDLAASDLFADRIDDIERVGDP